MEKIFADFDGAIALTSANVSGEKTANSALEISKDFAKTNLDLLVIDSGKLESQNASTVIKINQNNLEVLREGAIPIAKIKNS